MAQFGDFSSLCHTVPSYPWCNLFYRQLQHESPSTLASSGVSSNSSTAPVGINPECGIPLVNTDGSLGNIANIIACGLSVVFVLLLIVWTTRRKAAVGRIEFRIFLILYLVTVALQLITTGSFLRQGTNALVALTAIHAGFVASLFWSLLANALVATQVVEDGTMSSIIPLHIFNVLFLAATTYISFDVALTITHTFGPSNPPQDLQSIPLFVLTSVWPAAAAFLYFVIMAYIILRILRERKPLLYYLCSAVLFVLSQLDYFLLNKVICQGSNSKVDGSFVATILESLAVAALYLGWRSITEESWDDEQYMYRN